MKFPYNLLKMVNSRPSRVNRNLNPLLPSDLIQLRRLLGSVPHVAARPPPVDPIATDSPVSSRKRNPGNPVWPVKNRELHQRLSFKQGIFIIQQWGTFDLGKPRVICWWIFSGWTVHDRSSSHTYSSLVFWEGFVGSKYLQTQGVVTWSLGGKQRRLRLRLF